MCKMRMYRAITYALATAGSIRPRHMADIRRTAAIRRQSGADIVRVHGDFTRQQFAAAKKRRGGVVAVVIPCHNEAEDLPGTLLSIARAGNAVPIVVDNTSTDNTAQVARDMGAVVLDQPTGKKMAATQSGFVYAAHKLSAKVILFTDGDTLVLPDWAQGMASKLTAADKGKGVAMFGPSVAMFGSSRLADLATTGLNLTYKVMHARRGEPPIAHGHNYGLLPDAAGAMEAALLALNPDAFVWPTDAVPDDYLIRQAMIEAGATVVGSHFLDVAVLTRNDRIHTISQVVAIGRGNKSYFDHLADSYATQYGAHVPTKRPATKPKLKAAK
jgi:glycosyltransferase involved in cell wall biosynthesis